MKVIKEGIGVPPLWTSETDHIVKHPEDLERIGTTGAELLSTEHQFRMLSQLPTEDTQH